MSRKVQLMTNNESDLGERMDAATASSSPSDQSVKFELNQTIVTHLGTSVALSIIAGLGLLLVRFGTEFNFLRASGWAVWGCAICLYGFVSHPAPKPKLRLSPQSLFVLYFGASRRQCLSMVHRCRTLF